MIEITDTELALLAARSLSVIKDWTTSNDPLSSKIMSIEYNLARLKELHAEQKLREEAKAKKPKPPKPDPEDIFS